MKQKSNILVIGDIMIDHYLWGSCNRISPEAPVQIVDVTKETNVLGGAGNVVNNLVALGSDVTVLSVVGEDKIADELTKMLKDIEVRHFLICDENRKTTKKSRIIASAQQIVRYDHETKENITAESEAILISKILEIIGRYDLVLVSDYGKGVVTDTLMSKIIFLCFWGKSKCFI